jgi:hypothetical protein
MCLLGILASHTNAGTPTAPAKDIEATGVIDHEPDQPATGAALLGPGKPAPDPSKLTKDDVHNYYCDDIESLEGAYLSESCGLRSHISNVPSTERLSNAGIDVPQETITQIERNTLSKADLVDWYQYRVNQL